MGSFIVRVDVPQRKTDGQKGGKLPESLSTRKRRGSRGRRKGRARVGKTRSLARSAARESANRIMPGKKGSRAARLARARLRRANWVEGRFAFVADWLRREVCQGDWAEQHDGTIADVVGLLSRSRRLSRVRALLWLRLKQLADNLRRKAFPCGPFLRDGGRVDTWGWFRRFWEVKYGTWDDVSWLGSAGNSSTGPFGRLSDGYHRYPARVLINDVEIDPRVESRTVRVGGRRRVLSSRQSIDLHRSNAQRRRGASRLTDEDGSILRGEDWRRERERIESLFRSPRRQT